MRMPVPDFSHREEKTDDSLKVIALESVDDLEKLYASPPVSEFVSGMHNVGKMMPNSRRIYTIYTVNSLAELRELTRRKYLRKIGEKAKKENTLLSQISETSRMIRFMLTKDDELLFAKEGSEPAHFVMTGETRNSGSSICRVAGNLLFNEDFSGFTLVTNKSGDFQPEFALLKRALAVLWVLHNNKLMTLDDSLHIQHYTGTRLGKIYSVSLGVLKAFVANHFDKKELQTFLTVNQEAKKRQVIYEPLRPAYRRRAGSARGGSKASRSLLSIFEEDRGVESSKRLRFGTSTLPPPVSPSKRLLKPGKFFVPPIDSNPVPQKKSHDRCVDDALYNLLSEEVTEDFAESLKRKKEKSSSGYSRLNSMDARKHPRSKRLKFDFGSKVNEEAHDKEAHDKEAQDKEVHDKEAHSETDKAGFSF